VSCLRILVSSFLGVCLLVSPTMADLASPANDLWVSTSNAVVGQQAAVAGPTYATEAGVSTLISPAASAQSIVSPAVSQDTSWSLTGTTTASDSSGPLMGESSPDVQPGPPSPVGDFDGVANWNLDQGLQQNVFNLHDGSNDGTQIIGVASAPGATLLVGLGLGLIGWIKRRIA
jgi:hypothetical protein